MPNTKAVGVAYSDPEFESLSVTGATTLTGAITATGGVVGTQTGNWIMPSATVAATGTNQATAAAITTGFTLVSAADATVGVLLPAAAAGKICIVKNNAAAVLKVWPAGTNAINAISASTNIAMASLTSAVFVAYDATTWYTVPLLPS
jgi:hypothetical protein